MSKPEMNVTQLREFLAGGDPVPEVDVEKMEFGYRDGTVLGDPMWHRRRSEIADGRLVVRSRWRGQVGEFPLAEVSCVVFLSVFLGGRLNENCSMLTWIVGTDARPIAEVPWGHTVQQQAEGAGLQIRSPQMTVDKAAVQTLRPELRLG